MWNLINPTTEPLVTCCQCGCSETPKATPVWNVYLLDGRISRVKAGLVDFAAGPSNSAVAIFSGVQGVARCSVAVFKLDDIDFIARDGVVEIFPQHPKSA